MLPRSVTFADTVCSALTLNSVKRVLGAIGPREDRFAVELEQVLRCRAVADEVGADARQADVVARPLADRRQLGEDLLRLGR